MSFLQASPASWSCARNLGGGEAFWPRSVDGASHTLLRATVRKRNKASSIVGALVHRHITLTNRAGVRG